MNKIFLAVTSLFLLTSCLKDYGPKDYTKENEQEILTYLSENNLSVTKNEYGVYYVIDEEGTGEKPINTDIVKANFTASLTNGDVFIETGDKGIHLNLQKVIPGLKYGIPEFKIGGSGKIIIPSRLGYGSYDVNEIPAGSVLVFDIQILDVYENIDVANDAEIQDYLVENELTESAIKTKSGLYYIIEEEGTGENPEPTDYVTVAYKGYFTNGNVFDESTVSGATFNLKGTIDGWIEGIPFFKEGGAGKLLIPSKLGYGYSGKGSIPGGAVLVFDIELKSIIND